MTQKTPYELRYELLAMAQSILTERDITERIKLENDWNMKCESIRIEAERKGMTPVFPEFPVVATFSVKYMIDVADRLNEFVSNNKE